MEEDVVNATTTHVRFTVKNRDTMNIFVMSNQILQFNALREMFLFNCEGQECLDTMLKILANLDIYDFVFDVSFFIGDKLIAYSSQYLTSKR